MTLTTNSRPGRLFLKIYATITKIVAHCCKIEFSFVKTNVFKAPFIPHVYFARSLSTPCSFLKKKTVYKINTVSQLPKTEDLIQSFINDHRARTHLDHSFDKHITLERRWR